MERLDKVVAGVDINEPLETAKKYFSDQRYTFANLLGSGDEVVRNYGAEGIPKAVLIDKNGVVRFVHQGWGPGMDLADEVRKLLQ